MKITIKEAGHGQVGLVGPDGEVVVPIVFLISKLKRLGHGELIFSADVDWKQLHVIRSGIVTSGPLQGIVIECIVEAGSMSTDTMTFDHILYVQHVEAGKVSCLLQLDDLRATLFFTAEAFVKVLRENGLEEIKISQADWYWFKKNGSFQSSRVAA